MTASQCNLLASAENVAMILETADWILLALGAILAIGWPMAALRRGQPVLGIPSQPRPHRMPPEAIFLPVVAYLAAGLLLRPAISAVAGPAATAELEPGVAPVTLADVLSNNLAMAVGAIACLFVGWRYIGDAQCRFIRGSGRVGRQMLEAVAGVLIALALCYATLFVTERGIQFLRPDFVPPQHNVINALRSPDRPAWLPVVLWISVAVVTPVAEECFFRGVLQTALGQVLRQRGLAIVFVGLLFGLAHSQQPQVIPALALFGVILGVLYERHGGLLAPIVAHALFNAKTLLWEFLAPGLN